MAGPDGKIRTVVNASGAKGNSGDGGPALAATMNGPSIFAWTRMTNATIADAENHIVRKIFQEENKIVRVAGTGKKGELGVGGDPLKRELADLHGVTVHPQTGELYITCTLDNWVSKDRAVRF